MKRPSVGTVHTTAMMIAATLAQGRLRRLRVRPAEASNRPDIVMARVLSPVSVFTVSVIGSPAAS